MTDNKKRFEHIDSMRAIAALLVVWLHTSEVFVNFARPSIQDGLHNIASFFDFGRIGVVLFFAISGFVIPASLKGDRLSGSRAFLIKRFFRLYPVYWLSIPFAVITSWYLWGKDISLSAILWNLTMIQEAIGHSNAEGVYWTLQTELVFYALCVGLFLIGGLRSIWVLSSLVFVLTAAYIAPPLLNGIGIHLPSITNPTVGAMCLNLGVMFWGTLFRAWIEQRPFPLIGKVALFGYVVCWCGLAIMAIKLLSVNDAYWKLYGTYAIGVVLFSVLTTTKKVSTTWLAWLGTISYSIYLFHPVVMYTISWNVQASNIEWIKGWTTGSYMLLTVVLTVLLSAITHRYVELPAIRLGDYLSKRSASKFRGAVEPG